MESDWEGLKLNDTGKEYLKVLVKQLKDNNLYLDGDDVLRLTDIAIEHQLYQKARLDAEFDDGNKFDLKAQRHRKARDEGLKAVGQGATQRATLKVPKKEVKKKTIMDKIAKKLDE